MQKARSAAAETWNVLRSVVEVKEMEERVKSKKERKGAPERRRQVRQWQWVREEGRVVEV